MKHFLCIGALALALTGCATYQTPGAGVSLGDLTQAPPDIAELFEREPAAEFPARIATARLQAAGFQAGTTTCHGRGAFCIVTARDLEEDDEYARLAELNGVAGIGRLTRLLVPAAISGIDDLRQAAAGLKADVLLVYSVDTRFIVEGQSLGPLSVVSLGLIPNKRAHVTSTASAALVDVRSGFIYGVAEATDADDQRATVWSTRQAIESARLGTEQRAFQQMVKEVESLWSGIMAARGNKE
ncbi:MAG: hypothetical protein ACXIUB_07170 [Wenzhouxiangella sp.]